MKFSLRGLMKSTPSFALTNHIDQLSASVNAKASGAAHISKMSVTVSKIPVHLRIPFLKRTHRALLIGSVGGATLSIDPFSISVKEVSLNATGLLGDKDGITMTNDVSVKCQTSMDAQGAVAGKAGLGSIDLGCLHPEDDYHDHEEHASHHDSEHHHWHRRPAHDYHVKRDEHFDHDDHFEHLHHDEERHEHHEEDGLEYRTPPIKSRHDTPLRKAKPVKPDSKKIKSGSTPKSSEGQRRS